MTSLYHEVMEASQTSPLTFEQETSLSLIKAFVLDNTTHNITICWNNNKPIFRASDVGKVLGIVHITTTITKFDDDEKVVHTTHTPGGPQQVHFLTEAGLYRLLFISRKPIAKPFRKWVTEVLTSIRTTGGYQLQIDQQVQEISQKLIQETIRKHASETREACMKERHHTLIDAYKGPNRPVVYFGKIRDVEDGHALIKIGSTEDVKVRSSAHPQEYGSCWIFEVMDVAMYRQFESFLHKHDVIGPLAFKGEVFRGHRSSEVFRMTDSDVEKALSIAKRNIYKYMGIPQGEHMLELQHLRAREFEARATIAHYNNSLGAQNRADDDNPPEDIEVPLPTVYFDEKRYNQARGDKIQRYSTKGKILLETYNGHAEAGRDVTLDGPTPGGIKSACKGKTLYKGFRWANLARNLPDDTVQDIGETVISSTVQKGFVAMLNLARTRIENVFCDQKAASEDRKFSTGAAVCKAIKEGTQSGGHYFRMWKDCPEDLQEAYLDRARLPEKRAPKGSQRIVKRHPLTGGEIHTYVSVSDVIRDVKISRKSLFEALDHGGIVKGFKWSRV